MYHVEKKCENCLTPCLAPAVGRPWAVCVYAVIQQQEEILLVRREGEGVWTLPGGVIHHGQTVETALRDFVLRASGLELLLRFQPHVRECPHKHHFLIYREAVPTVWSIHTVSPEKDPAITCEWFLLDRLPLKLAAHAKSYLFHERNLDERRDLDMRRVG